MAHSIQALRPIQFAKVVHIMAAPFVAVYNFMVEIAVSNSRMEVVKTMSELSDLELATKYGIERDEIVQYVFRDIADF